MYVESIQKLTPAIEVEVCVLLGRRHESIRTPTALGHIVGKNLRDKPTSDTTSSHPLIDGEDLEIPVEVTFIDRHLVRGINNIRELFHKQRRSIAKELIPPTEEAANESNLAIMQESRGYDPPFMLNDEGMTDPLVRIRKHPIDCSDTFRVMLRTVEVGLEHDVQGIVKESLCDNSCHFGNISTRGRSTLHRAPPQFTSFSPNQSSKT